MALTRAELRLPPLPKKTVNVPELGGEVIVRGLLLRDRLALVDEAGPQDMGRVARLLAATVIAPDDTPLLTVEEWEQFGAVHFAATLSLFGEAAKMAGLAVEAAEKN
jgi:hypothetical protein